MDMKNIDRSTKEKACSTLGCNSKMYCYGGQDNTVYPRVCEEAQEVIKKGK